MSGASVRSSRQAVPRGTVLAPQTTRTGGHLELVEHELLRRRRRTMLGCALLGAVLIGGPFVVVSMHVRMAQEQYHLNDIRVMVDRAEVENRAATARVATLKSPAGIVPAARRLHLVPALSVTVITVADSGSGSASAGDDTATHTSADGTKQASGATP